MSATAQIPGGAHGSVLLVLEIRSATPCPRDLACSGPTALRAGQTDARARSWARSPMSAATHGKLARNRILGTLARAEYRRLKPSLEEVALDGNEVLCAPGDVVRYIYFPNDAVISLLVNVDDRRSVEVAMEGNEGAVGLVTHLGGVECRNLSIVRDGGSAMRLAVDMLARHTAQRGRLQGLLSRSVSAFVMQIAQSAICNRFHSVEARLARWLLMTHDRVGSGELRATQESIAHLLGVRRSSVSVAARTLYEQQLIAYRRGRIDILDLIRLRAVACPCYEIIRRQYDSFLRSTSD